MRNIIIKKCVNLALVWGCFMKYSVFYHNVKCDGDIGEFLSAGILVEDSTGREIRRIFDVSVEFSALQKLVLSLNAMSIAPEHLDGILEDYYSEHC